MKIIAFWVTLTIIATNLYALEEVMKIEKLLTQGASEEALSLANMLVTKEKSPQAFLARGKVYLYRNEKEKAIRDIIKSTELDPTLREAWLLLGGVFLAKKSYQQALRAFLKAEELDRSDPANDLNIGAVLLFSGDEKSAETRFSSYLAKTGLPKDYYLVAKNYAFVGNVEKVIKYLQKAIEEDEKIRRFVRKDPLFNFYNNPNFYELMNKDNFIVPPNYFVSEQKFKIPYSSKDPILLYSVLDALYVLKEPFDPAVEVTPEWAIIWGRCRIKVWNNQSNGMVTVSCPPDKINKNSFSKFTNNLFRSINIQLYKREKGIRKGTEKYGRKPGAVANGE